MTQSEIEWSGRPICHCWRKWMQTAHLQAVVKLNETSAKYIDQISKSNEKSAILNEIYKPTAVFREFEWHLYQNEWKAYEIDREILYYRFSHSF